MQAAMLISDAVEGHYGPALAAAAPEVERVILSLEGSTNELDRVEVVAFPSSEEEGFVLSPHEFEQDLTRKRKQH